MTAHSVSILVSCPDPLSAVLGTRPTGVQPHHGFEFPAFFRMVTRDQNSASKSGFAHCAAAFTVRTLEDKSTAAMLMQAVAVVLLAVCSRLAWGQGQGGEH